MANVKLEFEELQILRPKKRWKVYFVVVAEHPTDPDKMVVTSLPSQFITIKPRQNNVIYFEPEEGDGGADGFFVLERDMPADRRLSVRVYMRHSREGKREVGQLLQDIEGELGSNAFGIITDILGTTSPWLVIAKKAIPLIGGILTRIRDRDFGFVSMDEEFGPEFENQTELDRANNFSSGDAKIVWSWSVRD
jgi:hypothetical protein